MNIFDPFDPLRAKYVVNSDVATKALKREILNILGSYVGWYDPFCELIQNALDSIEERATQEEKNYIPSIWITINIQENSLVVTDNGIGLDEQKFQSFLAPDFSFKSGATRGHKGVGATYIAYGFNYIQICTKTNDFYAIGKMVNARKWLYDDNPSGNPKIKYDNSGPIDTMFNQIDKGVSMYVKFDKNTHPKDLDWIKADNANSWLKILSVKTGLGAFNPNPSINVDLTVINKQGIKTNVSQKGIEYLWPHKIVKKAASYKQIKEKREELFNKDKDPNNLPSYLKNLDIYYDTFRTNDLQNLVKLDQNELDICYKYKPSVYFSYAYSVSIWNEFNKSLQLRNNLKILHGGIQIAADNMPQGESTQIPLNRNTGRQNQIHFVYHFGNCSADLGRKGFHSEIIDFAKEVSRKIVDNLLKNAKKFLKPNTGTPPDIFREKEIDDWKEEMDKYEKSNPLRLISEHFFLPIKTISITSKPSREQDVIALFNQLIAGGVVRGIRIMSTNERFTYDGLYKIVIDDPITNHTYNKHSNPLGISKDIINQIKLPFISKPRIIEYKYTLDGLIEDIQDGSKNSNDIELVVAWDTGESYVGNYKITSLLDENNLFLRQYHGITHIMTNITTGQKEMDLIILEELIDFLIDPEKTQKQQIKKYED
ncbi:Histidine kinase-, DNA gyrase B-, and HSP90-like ATPase [Desulfotomaculum arcticum]|uniref:Histidine kinase-, DNA gyrase B-, and HSP90-like ATPase n=1 Tax=Desulfotruncus arcticus DSM 17038 TaxID=1121424 RepID=A0A1I2XBW5_9FIRM|nr:ATP-binding protein [Desulfotruncus arcticus]SFH10537.1 Histidine kinase-, DNA gyrase B-, and HSP90-like ATPase [Desulfotomaculum arcticum] [Desulfotruncus arcticus DSM 17038]